MLDHEVVYVDTDVSLLECCLQLQKAKAVAVDTEFIRIRTFYPKPGLFQAYDGDKVFLIDPLVISDWGPFVAFLESESVVKIFHACDEDVELFYHFLNVETRNVFDTQVAAAFCGYDFSMGYQRLLVAMLGVELEKEASRSDWLQRPLSGVQVSYAANDVIYLLDIYKELQALIAQRDFDGAVREELSIKMSQVKKTDFSDAYRRVKQASKLKGKDFMVLKGLAEWREKMMREYDTPRNKIATNDALLALSKVQLVDGSALKKISGLSRVAVHNAASIAALISVVRALPLESSSSASKAKDVNFLNRLKHSLGVKAKEIGVAEQMLSKKRYNEKLAVVALGSSLELERHVSGWRLPIYREVLVELGCDL